MYYPLVFESIYKEMVWGGEKLNNIYGRTSPYAHTGESWDISCRKDEMSIVKNGEYSGETFLSVINKNVRGFLGENFKNFSDFPLLVKLIDARDFLSVQVHPGDDYAREKENYPRGKNEMWYILSAEPESYLIVGLKGGVTKEMFQGAIENGTATDCLNKMPVTEGDIINIPAGLIHAIGKGIVLAEVQQNSDITYRVYDYNRVGLNGEKRELHIEKSLDVIDFSGKLSTAKVIPSANGGSCSAGNIRECIKNKYFSINMLDLQKDSGKSFIISGNKEFFSIYICVKGSAQISWGDGAMLNVKPGDSVFMPAYLDECAITGGGKFLTASAFC
ncbi:MAG: class I mannose-6-phosphate isomerase [Clostridiales bacterium]|jgi:mannose-6-phosphate isomerase|nr:class I mannose-6-phosphate isomerase [Clostridiales bacterium]